MHRGRQYRTGEEKRVHLIRAEIMPVRVSGQRESPETSLKLFEESEDKPGRLELYKLNDGKESKSPTYVIKSKNVIQIRESMEAFDSIWIESTGACLLLYPHSINSKYEWLKDLANVLNPKPTVSEYPGSDVTHKNCRVSGTLFKCLVEPTLGNIPTFEKKVYVEITDSMEIIIKRRRGTIIHRWSFEEIKNFKFPTNKFQIVVGRQIDANEAPKTFEFLLAKEDSKAMRELIKELQNGMKTSSTRPQSKEAASQYLTMVNQNKISPPPFPLYMNVPQTSKIIGELLHYGNMPLGPSRSQQKKLDPPPLPPQLFNPATDNEGNVKKTNFQHNIIPSSEEYEEPGLDDFAPDFSENSVQSRKQEIIPSSDLYEEVLEEENDINENSTSIPAHDRNHPIIPSSELYEEPPMCESPNDNSIPTIVIERRTTESDESHLNTTHAHDERNTKGIYQQLKKKISNRKTKPLDRYRGPITGEIYTYLDTKPMSIKIASKSLNAIRTSFVNFRDDKWSPFPSDIRFKLQTRPKITG